MLRREEYNRKKIATVIDVSRKDRTAVIWMTEHTERAEIPWERLEKKYAHSLVHLCDEITDKNKGVKIHFAQFEAFKLYSVDSVACVLVWSTIRSMWRNKVGHMVSWKQREKEEGWREGWRGRARHTLYISIQSMLYLSVVHLARFQQWEAHW